MLWFSARLVAGFIAGVPKALELVERNGGPNGLSILTALGDLVGRNGGPNGGGPNGLATLTALGVVEQRGFPKGLGALDVTEICFSSAILCCVGRLDFAKGLGRLAVEEQLPLGSIEVATKSLVS